METLAINGGVPVRTIPMPPCYIGAELLGKEEKALEAAGFEVESIFSSTFGNIKAIAKK